MGAIVPVVFFVMLAMGAPIFVVLGLTSSLGFTLNGQSLVPLAQKVIDQLNAPVLLSIPFFVMAATYMQKGGIAAALVDMTGAWFGWLRGSLGVVSIIACVIFAAICGSSIATCIAMGTILIPAMTARGYDRPFALGLIGASGTLGILIPPSLPLILYAIIADESVPRLFLAGVVPGLMVATMFTFWVLYQARKRKLPKGDPITRAELIHITLYALPALSIPFIIAVGIYGGFVTVSEAAALSAFVALAISIWFYKSIKFSEVIPVTAQALGSASVIILIIAVALAFGHWITETGVPATVVRIITEAGLSSWQFLLIINVVMFFLGMFLEVASILLITLPILLPILEPLGINPIHFAIILTINMEIAMITPPVGLNLFVLTGISGAPISETIRGVMPFVFLLLIMLVLITFVPSISLWLPTKVFG